MKNKNNKYHHTRWKRVKGLSFIGIRFFTDDYGISGYFKVLKVWKCKSYHPYASNISGTHWFDKGMILIVTDDGRKFKIPYFPWMKAYDDNEKPFSDYFDKYPWLN